LGVNDWGRRESLCAIRDLTGWRWWKKWRRKDWHWICD